MIRLSQKISYLVLVLYLLFLVISSTVAWRTWDRYTNLPVMDAIGINGSGKFRACVVGGRANERWIRVELVDEQMTYSSELDQWVNLTQPPFLGTAWGLILYGDEPLLLPKRGDIIEFYPQYIQESSPGSYGRIIEIEIVGKASDKLLATCDERWEMYRK